MSDADKIEKINKAINKIQTQTIKSCLEACKELGLESTQEQWLFTARVANMLHYRCYKDSIVNVMKMISEDAL